MTIIYIGGMASNRHQVADMTEMLRRHFNTDDVRGMSFSESWRDIEGVRRLAQGATLLTHSAGMLVAAQCLPERLIAVAPPIPVKKRTLLRRAVTKTRLLVASGQASEQRRLAVRQYNKRATREHLSNPSGNLGKLHAISRFNATKEAVRLREQGVYVTVCSMAEDAFFVGSFSPQDEAIMESRGVRVVNKLPGHHDEMIIEPDTVLPAVL